MLISKLLREGFHLGFLALIIKIQITMNNEDIFLLVGTSSLDLTDFRTRAGFNQTGFRTHAGFNQADFRTHAGFNQTGFRTRAGSCILPCRSAEGRWGSSPQLVLREPGCT